MEKEAESSKDPIVKEPVVKEPVEKEPAVVKDSVVKEQVEKESDPTKPVMAGWSLRDHHLFVEALRKSVAVEIFWDVWKSCFLIGKLLFVIGF